MAAIAHAFAVAIDETEHVGIAVVDHDDDAALVYYQQKEMTKMTMTMMMSCSQVKIALKKKKMMKKMKIKTAVVHVGFAVSVMQAKPLPCEQVSVGAGKLTAIQTLLDCDAF